MQATFANCLLMELRKKGKHWRTHVTLARICNTISLKALFELSIPGPAARKLLRNWPAKNWRAGTSFHTPVHSVREQCQFNQIWAIINYAFWRKDSHENDRFFWFLNDEVIGGESQYFTTKIIQFAWTSFERPTWNISELQLQAIT